MQRAHLVALFPSDRMTVRDASQLTGRRVALALPNCTRRPTDCNTVRLLDQLDGFDIDPRLALTFDRAVDPAAVAAAMSITLDTRRDAGGIGVDRVVYDPSTHSVYAHPARQLAPGSRYTLRVRGTARNQLPTAAATFTTESATAGLLAMRRQLDNGSAYRAAGIPAGSRGLHVEQSFPAAGTMLSYTQDLGPKTAEKTVPVPNTSGTGAGRYVFGSYLAPSWLTRDTVIPQTGTRGPGPQVQGDARLPFVLIVPAGPRPASGWPVAIFGHGLGRSDADLFLAADFNASRGIATIATDVVGHGYGPLSTWSVTTGGRTTTFSAHARGVDADGSGTITSVEGASAPLQPSSLAPVGLRDGLRETVADLMTLVRAVGRSGDLGTGGTGPLLRPSGVTYYGQSFGGIYGVMLGGTDPLIPALVPNVSGGPVTEVARLSPSFRPLVSLDLAGRKPSLLNGGYFGFTESLPLRGDAPVTAPARGAIAIQQALADETWIQRSGSPETFAPLLRATPPAGSKAKRVLFQNAFGDQTVPNPTNYTVLAAGRLFDRENLYRNDRSPQKAQNPHGFLLNPTFVDGSLPGQQQVVAFLATGGRTVIDPNAFAPDGTRHVWEAPIANPAVLLHLNFPSPLHS